MRIAPMVVVAVLITACSAAAESDPEAGPATTTASEPSSTTTSVLSTTAAPSTVTMPPEVTTTSEAPSPPEETVIEVIVQGSDVIGGGRVRVPLGETVRLVVTSDVADEVHVHGFDLFLDLEPGTTGELVFDADVPGVFEVEFEGSGLLLVDLEVGG